MLVSQVFSVVHPASFTLSVKLLEIHEPCISVAVDPPMKSDPKFVRERQGPE